ncbi:unnamed protein product [Dibothriocephalus latus]|uniref:Uncharacterized protein n=1 Tax=Dibothriocephalus latus TaxID=60516 RepID=A0A3P7N4A3_DIBLA|nr:unnamed protein product [Dibothriocephalus latus]
MRTGTIVSVDSECSQLWPLCASCLSDDLEPCPLDPGSHLQVQSTSTSKDALLCGRCLARLCRPYYAVEVIVEVQFDSIALPSPLSADSEEAHRIHLCVSSLHFLIQPLLLIRTVVNGFLLCSR